MGRARPLSLAPAPGASPAGSELGEALGRPPGLCLPWPPACVASRGAASGYCWVSSPGCSAGGDLGPGGQHLNAPFTLERRLRQGRRAVMRAGGCTTSRYRGDGTAWAHHPAGHLKAPATFVHTMDSLLSGRDGSAGDRLSSLAGSKVMQAP